MLCNLMNDLLIPEAQKRLSSVINSLSNLKLVGHIGQIDSSRRDAFRGILEYNFGLEEVSFPKSGAR